VSGSVYLLFTVILYIYTLSINEAFLLNIGETFTTNRQSNVIITQINSYCGPLGQLGICDATSLQSGERAHFGVVIYNGSPTGMHYIYEMKIPSC
jgi:hypothetical protein